MASLSPATCSLLTSRIHSGGFLNGLGGFSVNLLDCSNNIGDPFGTTTLVVGGDSAAHQERGQNGLLPSEVDFDKHRGKFCFE